MLRMWSTFDAQFIRSTMQEMLEINAPWTLWQREDEGRQTFVAHLKGVGDENCILEVSPEVADEFRNTLPLFGHCGKKGDVIFKREKFVREGTQITFKVPRELKFKDRRLKERFTYKYQDFKNVSFKFGQQPEDRAVNYILSDLSTTGLSLIIPKSELQAMELGDIIYVTHITDQELPEALDSKVMYQHQFHTPEGLKTTHSDMDLIKVGVHFVKGLEHISYKSVASIVERKQKLGNGIECSGHNGLLPEEQKRIVSKISEENPKLGAALTDQIEDLERLRFLTNEMRKTFWMQVNRDLFARAVRICSKEFVYDLLVDVTENIREEFLEKLDTPLPPTAIDKAQKEILKFIHDKEKKGEFVLSPDSFFKYV